MPQLAQTVALSTHGLLQTSQRKHLYSLDSSAFHLRSYSDLFRNIELIDISELSTSFYNDHTREAIRSIPFPLNNNECKFKHVTPEHYLVKTNDETPC